jgi:hypothetical protein
LLRSADDEAVVGKPRNLWATSKTFVAEGARHLVTGYDHMLFLLALLLAAGPIAVREGMRRGLRDVAVVVTSFTLGHSITLVAAALELVPFNSKAVEIGIAASILLVAALNVLRPQRAAESHRPWLAFAFGLVHGFGFSSVLGELGLPLAERTTALAAFNVGIELAQLGLVALLLWPLARLARSRNYRPLVMQLGSAAIACAAVVWLLERTLG